MSDHLVLCANHLITSALLESTREPKFAESTGAFGEGTSTHNLLQCEAAEDGWDAEEFAFLDDGDAGGEKAECRICHEEDFSKKLEVPCACNGSLKFAHRKCVQRWCNEKKNTICEICCQPYQAGYTCPPYVARSEEVTALDIRESQNIPGSPREVHSPRVLAATVVAEHFLEAEYDECTTASGTRTAIIRSSVLILLAVLMMRHAFSLVDEDNDLYNLSSVFLLRVLTFLMPVYIMAWIATVLLQRQKYVD